MATYLYTDIVVLEDQELAVGGGSAATVLTTAAGSGTKHASGGSGATVETTASGSAPSYIYTAIVVLEGEELAASASGGSSTTVETTAAGAGTKEKSGGSAASVETTAAGAGVKATSGGSGAIVETTAVGAGRHDYATLSSPRATDITSESFRPVVDIAYTEYMAGTIYFGVFYGFGFYEDELTWNRIDGWSETPVVEGSEAARDTDGTQIWATTVALGYDDEGYTIAFVWDDGADTSEIVVGNFNILYVEPPPEFDLAVWLASFTDDAYTLAGEVQGPGLAGTVYAVATLPSEGDPTEEQIVAGLNADGNPARGAGSLSGVTGAFELTLAGLKGELVHHLHAVFEYEEVE